MKKLFSLLLMTVMAVAAWAGTYSHTFEQGELKTAGGDVTLSDVSWTADAATYVGWDSGKGIQIGSGKNPINGTWTLATSGISGTITSVKVNASVAKDGNTLLSVTAGNAALGSQETLTSTATDYTFTGSGSGDIVLSFVNTTKAFYIKSIEVTYEEGGENPPVVTVAAPVFSVPAGEVEKGTEVTVSSAEGTELFYTIDGSDPNDGISADGNSVVVTINEDLTIRAIAMDADANISEEASASYTVKADEPVTPPVVTVEPPVFSVPAGEVEKGTEVTVSSAEGTELFYTTDGSDPNDGISADGNSVVITINEDMTIRAIAMDAETNISEEASASYTVKADEPGEQALTAQFDFDNDFKTLFPNLDYTSLDNGGDAANFTDDETATVDNISVTVSPKVSGTDNRIWKQAPRLRMYSGSMTVDAPQGYNVTAISFTNGSNFNLTADKGDLSGSNWTGETPTVVFTCSKNTQINSMTVTIAKIEEGAVEMPTISGETPFVGSTTVTIEAEAGDIYYTLDGSDPTESSNAYDEPFKLTATTTVKAIAVVDGQSSNVASKTFEALPSVENIADFYNQKPASTVAFANPVIAIGQSSDKKYTYAQDASSGKGLLIYNNNASSGIGVAYSLGEVIPAGFQGNYQVYRSMPEFANASGFTAATSTVEVTPLELTPGQVTAENIYRYAVIKGATLTSDGNIVVGEESVVRYDRFGVSDPEDLTKQYDIYGVTGIFDNTMQFMPLEFVEVVEEPGITLAEALAGQDGEVKIGGELAVVLKCNSYAIVSDGNDWLKVYSLDAEEGDVVTNLTGTISGLGLNPELIATASEAVVDPTVEAEPTKIDFAYATYDTMKQLKSNQVIELVGYYKDGYIYQAAKGYGMHIAVSTDNMTGEFAEGKQQHFTGVVTFKEAWTPANGAPARVSQDSDDAYTNITFDVTEAGVATGVNTVKAFNGKDVEAVYNVNGQRVSNMGKGVYILRHTDGTTTKVLR